MDRADAGSVQDGARRCAEGERPRRDGRFVFDGNEYLVSYAGYLIEYLDQLFSTQRNAAL